MSTITKEFTKDQLQQIIETDHVQCGEASALARIALASLEAEPVPVSMKEHQIRELVNELRDIAVEYHGTQQLRERIARTVRAAMLQGAQPVSNRDELPDVELDTNESDRHWYLVSWCAKGGYVGFTDIYLSSPWANGSARKVAEIISELNMVTGLVITSVFPMPAAPQQEVK